MRRLVIAAAVASCLGGCASLPVAAYAGIGAILTGTAALTNADVSAAEAYCRWRGGCESAPTAKPSP